MYEVSMLSFPVSIFMYCWSIFWAFGEHAGTRTRAGVLILFLAERAQPVAAEHWSAASSWEYKSLLVQNQGTIFESCLKQAEIWAWVLSTLSARMKQIGCLAGSLPTGNRQARPCAQGRRAEKLLSMVACRCCRYWDCGDQLALLRLCDLCKR